jgi:hypothetical protein
MTFRRLLAAALRDLGAPLAQLGDQSFHVPAPALEELVFL